MKSANLWYWVVNDKSDANAGLRVRTEPIISRLKLNRFSVEISTPDELMPILESNTVQSTISGVIIAKPNDAKNSLLMFRLKELCIPVIIDLFDNYFAYSATATQRGIFWQWLNSLNSADGVIVSSKILKKSIQLLRPSIPLCEVTDPLPWLNQASTNQLPTPSKKWAKKSRVRKLLWFGIPSNPWYMAGIADLLKWRHTITDLVYDFIDEYTIELVICTKECHEATQAVAVMNSLGINTKFVSWTAEKCHEELTSAHCVLIPTGANVFSKSKTHNRLSESIEHHCLVLTSSEGPYEDLIGGAVNDDINLMKSALFGFSENKISELLAISRARLDKNNPFYQQTNNLGIWIEKIRISKNVMNDNNQNHNIMIVGTLSNTSAVKQARKYNYLIAGYNGNNANLTYDLLLESINPSDLSCTLIFSEKFLSMLDSSEINELEALGANTFKFKFNSEFKYLLSRIETIKFTGVDIGSLTTEFHSLNIFILGNVLKLKREIKFYLNTNSAECWQGYGSLCNEELINSANRLEEIWGEYHG